jgi:sulfotransferase
MQKNIHFISGLPRAGSTLLSSLLRQNPRVHASMSSPVCSLFNALQREVSQQNEYSVFIDDKQRAKILGSCVGQIEGGQIEGDTHLFCVHP